MSADNILADVGNEARAHWHAERPAIDRPSAAELADPSPLGHRPWCDHCHCRHGHNDPWCAKETA